MQLKDFLNSINDTKENLMDSDTNCERLYTPYVINRCMSYFSDTILHANQMNQFAGAPNKLQYDYYMNSIRKRKRFSKWLKNESSEDIELIKQYYNYSEKKAREALEILGEYGISRIRALYGGKS
jgi:NACalpha-BTF3-like transcription factor